MGFPAMSELRGLPDPLLQYRWTLIVANVPGGGDGRRLQYQCKTSSIPGLSNEDGATVTSHGMDFHFMGRQMFGGTQSATFFETRDLIIMKSIRGWLNFGRDHRNGSGNYKADYATTAQMLLLDDTLKVVTTVNFDGFFPKELSESGVDGSSSAVVDWS